MVKEKLQINENGLENTVTINDDVETIKSKKRKAAFTWYIFLLPSFIGILLFMVYPIVESFRLSFFKRNY